MKKIIIILITLFLTCGCSNYKELNELGIITAIGIDKNDNKYEVTLELINVFEGTEYSITESPIMTLTAEGKTIFEAGRNLNTKSPKMFFLADMEYVILSPKILEEDLPDVIDYLTREIRLSLNYLIVTSTENTNEEILSSISKSDIIPASNITNLSTTSEKRNGITTYLDMKTFLNNYLTKRTSSIISNLYINKDNEADNLDTLKSSDTDDEIIIKSSVTLNANNKLVELEDEEVLIYNFINNNIENVIVTTKCDDGYVSIESLDSKFKLKDNLDKDEIIVNGKLDAEIVYYGCSDNLNSTETLSNLEKLYNKTLSKYITDTFNKSKEIKADFLGIGDFIYKNNYEYYDFDSNNWQKEGINNIKLVPNIEVNLYKQGNLRGDANE